MPRRIPRNDSSKKKKRFLDVFELLCHLDQVTSVGPGWRACCPAHDDTTPSLNIDIAWDGRILIYCHAGCPAKQIMQALGLTLCALFPIRRVSAGAPMKMRRQGAYHDFGPMSERFQSELSRYRLQRLAHDLGVSARSLQSLGVGFDGEAFTFPMFDPHEKAIGIRRRFADGQKRAVKGSRNGLFLPASKTGVRGGRWCTSKRNPGMLFVCEGPTDTAAMLDLGFSAVGRASCSSTSGDAKAYVELHRPECVVIVADNDEPGVNGANRLAEDLRSVCKSLKVISPPARYKDVRSWKLAGATRERVISIVQRAANLTDKSKRKKS